MLQYMLRLLQCILRTPGDSVARATSQDDGDGLEGFGAPWARGDQ